MIPEALLWKYKIVPRRKSPLKYTDWQWPFLSTRLSEHPSSPFLVKSCLWGRLVRGRCSCAWGVDGLVSRVVRYVASARWRCKVRHVSIATIEGVDDLHEN